VAFELIVVGTSLGGLRALEILLSGLPKSLPIPVAIVQHRYKAADNTLIALLQQHTLLQVKEPEDKEVIASGHIYIAPANYHLLVEVGSFALSTEAPVAYARPSIDVLFESAADAYAEKVVGVILTGANNDGAGGLKRIKKRGGLAIVQEPATAECSTMPAAAIETVAVNHVLPLADISSFLVSLCMPS